MSTYGEIIEPVSRTAWEDWDDGSPQISTNLIWQLDVPAATDIDKFLIFEGKYLFDCITQQTKCRFELINSINDLSLHLFKAESVAEYMCVMKDYELLQSSEIVELLKPYITASRDVIAVQTKPLAEYQSTEISNQNCVVRTVCTTGSSSSEMNFPKLEQPNIISGVSAGVINLRQHLGLCGKGIICFVEHSEENQIEEVQILLKKLNIIPNNSRPSKVINSNLYI